MIDALTKRTAGAIQSVEAQLPKDFPMDVADAIFAGLARQTQKLANF